MNTKHKFCRGDYCVLKSPKSSNNGEVVEVIEYPMKNVRTLFVSDIAARNSNTVSLHFRKQISMM